MHDPVQIWYQLAPSHHLLEEVRHRSALGDCRPGRTGPGRFANGLQRLDDTFNNMLFVALHHHIRKHVECCLRCILVRKSQTPVEKLEDPPRRGLVNDELAGSASVAVDEGQKHPTDGAKGGDVDLVELVARVELVRVDLVLDDDGVL